MSYKKVFTVRTAMKKESAIKFDWFEIYGVFTTRKNAIKAIEKSYEVNKGTNISEYKDGTQHQINYDLLSIDGVKCNYRALIDEHSLNRNWID